MPPSREDLERWASGDYSYELRHLARVALAAWKVDEADSAIIHSHHPTSSAHGEELLIKRRAALDALAKALRGE